MAQQQAVEKKMPFSGRIHSRIMKELEWLADWHGSTKTWVHEQAIHQMALRDLPGLKETGIVQFIQAKPQEETREQMKEEQLV